MNQTLVVAGVAALAIIVIAIGIATSGSGSGISSRLERYASGKQDSPKVSTGQGPISDLAQRNRITWKTATHATMRYAISRASRRMIESGHKRTRTAE